MARTALVLLANPLARRLSDGTSWPRAGQEDVLTSSYRSAMTYEFTYEVTDDLIRQAARRFLLHRLHWRARIAVTVYVLLVLLMCAFGAPGYICGFFAGAGGLLALLVALAYGTRVRRVRVLYRRLSTRTVRCVLSQDTLQQETALGSASIPWHLFDQVVRAPDVWLFSVGGMQNVSLPADKLRGEVGRFIEERVVAAGGRVVGETEA